MTDVKRIIDELRECVKDGPESVTPQLLEEAASTLARLSAQNESLDRARAGLAKLWDVERASSTGLVAENASLRAALRAIMALDLKKRPDGHDDFYSGVGAFINAWTIARDALRQAEACSAPIQDRQAEPLPEGWGWYKVPASPGLTEETKP